MRFNSTTLMRIGGLILIAAGAYGIYSWQMKQEKIVTRTVQASQDTPAASRPVSSTPLPRTQTSQPAPAPVQQQEVKEPEARPQYSYEQCWQIARRAANDDSVAVPPECREAQADYERRQQAALEARRQQEREAAEARERQRQEQERIAEQQRREEEQRRAEAEQNRLRNEQVVREANERLERERQERSRSVERLVDGVINKIKRRPY